MTLPPTFETLIFPPFAVDQAEGTEGRAIFFGRPLKRPAVAWLRVLESIHVHSRTTPPDSGTPLLRLARG